MNSIILGLFWKVIRPLPLVLSGMGFCLGLSFVLFGLEIYQTVFGLFKNEIEKSDYVVLSKDVAMLNTFLNAKSIISHEELDSLRNQPFVENIGVFTPNHYRVWAKVSASHTLAFSTEMFFESVPDAFIDNLPDDFSWDSADDVVPIIVSEDFVNLYNYGYAISSGLPQISKGTVALIPLQLEFSGNGGQRIFAGKIVGYSERISSVLVPQNFMDWANANIGAYKGEDLPSRLIVKTNKIYAASMGDYLKRHQLLIHSDKLGAAKLGAVGKLIVDLILFLGVAFLLLSFVIVVLNFSLIITEAKEEIKLLLQLGYKVGSIAKNLWIYLSGYLLFVFISAALVFVVARNLLLNSLFSRGILVEKEVTMVSSALLLSLLYLTMVFWGYFTIRQSIKGRNG